MGYRIDCLFAIAVAAAVGMTSTLARADTASESPHPPSPGPPPASVPAGTASDSLPGAGGAAHLQLRTSDGKGLISLDGVPRGEGVLLTDLSPGRHTFAVTREGYKPVDKTLTLGANESWAETVTLEPVGSLGRETGGLGRAYEGVYGGFGLAPMFGVGGEGTELETNCDTLGARSCDTPSPWGGGLFGYVGYTWNPVGFEFFLAASFDQSSQAAHFDGKGGNSGTLPFTSPARDEAFHFYRAGGLAALRVRASIQGKTVRASLAGGLGFSYKQMFMTRKATALDGSGRQEAYVPDTVAYVSPAITLEGALQLRVSPSVALSLGIEVWADNASTAGSNSSPPSPGHALVGNGQPPAPIQTPEYHFATGPQAFIGPFVGMQFGP